MTHLRRAVRTHKRPATFQHGPAARRFLNPKEIEVAKAPEFRFDLGAELRDAVTGHQGIVTARTEWLNGCKRYAVQSKAQKDGIPVEAYWVDEDQAELVTTPEPKPPKKATGGPQRDPSRGREL